MKNFTAVQYQILSQFQIEHIQLFKEQFFIKLNKLFPQCSVKMLTYGIYFRRIEISPYEPDGGFL